jgi:hypothetical protein
MEILLTLAYTALFIFLITKIPFFKLEGIKMKWILFVFLLKIAFGIAMALIYTFYYPVRSDADIFKYFDDSGILYNMLFINPSYFIRMLFGIHSDTPELRPYFTEMLCWYNIDTLYNDNRTLIRFNTILRFFSFGSYYVHVVFMCFISLTGLIAMFKVFTKIILHKTKEIFFIVFLLPSVLFWGSGVMKDGLLLFAFGMFLYFFIQLLDKITFKNLLWIFLLSILILINKVYILLAAIPGFIAWYWAYKTAYKFTFTKFAFVHFIYFIILFNFQYIIPRYNFVEIMYAKQYNFLRLADFVNAGSRIPLTKLEHSNISLLLNIPEAIYHVLFRPFFFESRSPMILMAGMENLLILIIMLTGILFMKKKMQKEVQPLFNFSLYFVLILFSIMGLVTPVLGALVRYKMPALPFLLLLFIILYDKEKLLKKIPILKKLLIRNS